MPPPAKLCNYCEFGDDHHDIFGDDHDGNFNDELDDHHYVRYDHPLK